MEKNLNESDFCKFYKETNGSWEFIFYNKLNGDEPCVAGF